MDEQFAGARSEVPLPAQPFRHDISFAIERNISTGPRPGRRHAQDNVPKKWTSLCEGDAQDTGETACRLSSRLRDTPTQPGSIFSSVKADCLIAFDA